MESQYEILILFVERPFFVTFVNFRVNLFWASTEKKSSKKNFLPGKFYAPRKMHSIFSHSLFRSTNRMRNWTINYFILLFFRAPLLRAFPNYSFFSPPIHVTLFELTVSYFPLILSSLIRAYEFFTIISPSMIIRLPSTSSMQWRPLLFYWYFSLSRNIISFFFCSSFRI